MTITLLSPNTEILALIAPVDPDHLSREGQTQDGLPIFGARWIDYRDNPAAENEFNLLRKHPRLLIIEERDYSILLPVDHHIIRFAVLPEAI